MVWKSILSHNQPSRWRQTGHQRVAVSILYLIARKFEQHVRLNNLPFPFWGCGGDNWGDGVDDGIQRTFLHELNDVIGDDNRVPGF